MNLTFVKICILLMVYCVHPSKDSIINSGAGKKQKMEIEQSLIIKNENDGVNNKTNDDSDGERKESDNNNLNNYNDNNNLNNYNDNNNLNNYNGNNNLKNDNDANRCMICLEDFTINNPKFAALLRKTIPVDRRLSHLIHCTDWHKHCIRNVIEKESQNCPKCRGWLSVHVIDQEKFNRVFPDVTDPTFRTIANLRSVEPVEAEVQMNNLAINNNNYNPQPIYFVPQHQQNQHRCTWKQCACMTWSILYGSYSFVPLWLACFEPDTQKMNLIFLITTVPFLGRVSLSPWHGILMMPLSLALSYVPTPADFADNDIQALIWNPTRAPDGMVLTILLFNQVFTWKRFWRLQKDFSGMRDYLRSCFHCCRWEDQVQNYSKIGKIFTWTSNVLNRILPIFVQTELSRLPAGFFAILLGSRI